MSEPMTTTEETAREAALPRVTPAAIIEAAEDPTVFAPLFRGMGMHNAFRLSEMMKNPNVSLRDRMEWQRMCMEFGQVPKTVAVQQGEQLPSITIVLPGSGRTRNAAAVAEVIENPSNTETVQLVGAADDE